MLDWSALGYTGQSGPSGGDGPENPCLPPSSPSIPPITSSNLFLYSFSYSGFWLGFWLSKLLSWLFSLFILLSFCLTKLGFPPFFPLFCLISDKMAILFCFREIIRIFSPGKSSQSNIFFSLSVWITKIASSLAQDRRRAISSILHVSSPLGLFSHIYPNISVHPPRTFRGKILVSFT